MAELTGLAKLLADAKAKQSKEQSDAQPVSAQTSLLEQPTSGAITSKPAQSTPTPSTTKPPATTPTPTGLAALLAKQAATVKVPPTNDFNKLLGQLEKGKRFQKLVESGGAVPTQEVVNATPIKLAKPNEYPKELPEHLQHIVDTVNKDEQQLEFDADQDNAVAGMLREQFSCLIGAAGTGKTTTLKRFLKELKGKVRLQEYEDKDGNKFRRLNIVFCAFTGRAVQQMKRVLPEEYHVNCGTIHGDKVLQYQPEFYEDIDAKTGLPKNKMRFVPSYNEWNKMKYEYYVIDEAGMLAVSLWNTMRKAMLPSARVIMVGDINQLPPVYGRSILGFAMTKWPVFELKTPHRAAMDNPITYNAHRILKGLMPVDMKNEHGEVILFDVGHLGSMEMQTKVTGVVKKLHQTERFYPLTDGLITSVNEGPIGQVDLNQQLVTYFNPQKGPHNKRYFIKTGMATVHYAVGDKVMMLANDKENNLTNGQIGVVHSVSINGSYSQDKGMSHHDLASLQNAKISDDDFSLSEIVDEQAEKETSREAENEMNQRQASHIVTVKFEGHEAEVTFSTAGDYRRLAHAYAFTCHKAQGGEYETVVIVVHSANRAALSREWLYTGETRGRKRVVFVYNKRGMELALKLQRIKGTTLAEKIRSFQELSKNVIGKVTEDVPDLPTPKQVTLEEV